MGKFFAKQHDNFWIMGQYFVNFFCSVHNEKVSDTRNFNIVSALLIFYPSLCYPEPSKLALDPNLASGLILYSLWAKNVFYIFEVLYENHKNLQQRLCVVCKAWDIYYLAFAEKKLLAPRTINKTIN